MSDMSKSRVGGKVWCVYVQDSGFIPTEVEVVDLLGAEENDSLPACHLHQKVIHYLAYKYKTYQMLLLPKTKGYAKMLNIVQNKDVI